MPKSTGSASCPTPRAGDIRARADRPAGTSQVVCLPDFRKNERHSSSSRIATPAPPTEPAVSGRFAEDPGLHCGPVSLTVWPLQLPGFLCGEPVGCPARQFERAQKKKAGHVPG